MSCLDEMMKTMTSVSYSFGHLRDMPSSKLMTMGCVPMDDFASTVCVIGTEGV